MKIIIETRGCGFSFFVYCILALNVLQEKGIKQTWLAEKLGKSFKMVNDYACNRSQPSLQMLYKIAEIFQVEMKELLSNC